MLKCKVTFYLDLGESVKREAVPSGVGGMGSSHMGKGLVGLSYSVYNVPGVPFISMD